MGRLLARRVDVRAFGLAAPSRVRALRFNASAEYLRVTANLPDETSFTICGRGVLVNDRNTFSAIATLESALSNASGYAILSTDGTGTKLELFDTGGNSTNGPTVTVGRPFFWALVGAGGGSLTGYFAHAGDATLTSWTRAGPTGYTPAVMHLGNDSFDEWLDGALAGISVYNVGLTAAEVEANWRQFWPAVTRGLIHFLPGVTAGHGRFERSLVHPWDAWTIGGAVTDETPLFDTWPATQDEPATRIFAPPAAGIFAPIGAASETDAALPIARSKARALGIATETDAALPIATGITRLIGTASETDAALPIARSKARALGIAIESDQALAITRPLVLADWRPWRQRLMPGRGPFHPLRAYRTVLDATPRSAQSLAIGIAVEIDSALPIGRGKLKTLGIAAETDAALPVARSKARTLGVASEVDSALPVVIGGAVLLGPATESDIALPFGHAKAKAIGIAAELDAALALGRTHARTLGTAAELDVALPVLWAPKIRRIGTAVETDSALAVVAGGSTAVVRGSLATGRPTSTGTRRPRATGGTRPRNTQ